MVEFVGITASVRYRRAVIFSSLEVQMDCLDWAASQVASDTSSASWQHSRQQLMPSLMVGSDSNCFAFHGSSKIGISEDILNSIQFLHKPDPSHGNFVSDHRLVSNMFQNFAPALLDQAHNVTSNWNNIRPQEEHTLKLAADDDDDDNNSRTNRTEFIIMNQLNGVITDFGNDDGALDCLLSATTSNTDLSIEDHDDGVSIFSDCKSLWNFKPANNIAVLSGDSASYNNSNKKEIEDQTLSQTSSDQYPNQSRLKKKRNETLTLTKLGQNDRYFEDGFQPIPENPPKPKRPRSDYKGPSSSNINFQLPSTTVVSSPTGGGEPDSEAIAQMKEMIYRAATFRPVNFGTELAEKPKRKNVRISSDPQTVAARQRRERISERIRVLQRLVPGGSKMDTASMLDEAANYLKFLRSQVKALEAWGQQKRGEMIGTSAATNFPFPSMQFNHPFPMQSCFPLQYS